MSFLDEATTSAAHSALEVPAYDRSALRPGIVHFGVGGFHRAHQAMYLDRLFALGRDTDFAICGVGVLPGDARMRDALAAQDHLYTLMLKHPDGRVEARVIGSIVDYLFAPEDPAAVVARLADPATRIVSLTVTEGGYNIDHVTGRFDTGYGPVVSDANALAARGAATAQDGEAVPGLQTVYAYIAEGLRARRAAGLEPFTVMSCDNLPGNGNVARHAITTFAGLYDEELAEWIAGNVRFPNSMVDRITPVTAPEDIARLRDEFGLHDRWPVVCEPFEQWVLEDDFTLGRPAYDAVGVQVVDDVEPYELMKLRLLNASHQALAYAGYLAGYRYAHEVAADPAFAQYLLAYMVDEGTPTLPPVPGIDLEDYRRTLVERFANPAVRDTLARLCAESSDRIPKWVLPVIRANLATGGPILRATTIIAAWARYARGVDEAGQPIEIVDPLAKGVTAAARAAVDDPGAFLDQREIFGDLAENERFAATFADVYGRLARDGAAATIAWVNAQPRGAQTP